MTVLEARIDDYGEQAVALERRGRAHVVPLESTRHRFLEAWLSLVAGADVRSLDLYTEADPRRTSELLPDWERAFGLPDCGPLPGSLILRRFTLVAKIAAQGGASRQYLIDVAAEAGFAITIEEHFHFVCGRARVGPGGTFGEETYPPGVLWNSGSGVAPHVWAATFTVRAPELTPTFFAAGDSGAGDLLVEADNGLLSCLLDAIKPAQTVIHYEFTDPPPSGYGPWEVLGPGPATVVCTAGNVLIDTGA